MILQFSLKTVFKVSKPYSMFSKTVLSSFAEKVIVCATKVRDELLEMGKDLTVTHSAFTLPLKSAG